MFVLQTLLIPPGEMFVNYMDYSPDQVTSMFTDGQMEIVNQTLEGDDQNYPFRRYLWSPKPRTNWYL